MERAAEVIEANARDIAAAPGFGLSAAAIDRLTLNPSRIDEMAKGPSKSPPWPTRSARRSPPAAARMACRSARCGSLGVIFMIYESRPNVTLDAAALCVKSGNAAILRGVRRRSTPIGRCTACLPINWKPLGLPADAVQLVPDDRSRVVGHLLRMPDKIDLAIPRGGESLIRRVVDEAEMPVLKHYQGNCHVYVDAEVDQEMAVRIVVNSEGTAARRLQRGGDLARPSRRRCELPPARGRSPDGARGRVARRRGEPPVGSEHDGGRTERLGHRVSREDPCGRRRRLDRAGDGAYRPPRLGTYRGDPDPQPGLGTPVRG